MPSAIGRLDGRTRFRIDTDTTGAGIAVMIVATTAFTASDSTVKVIGATVPLLALLWVRYLFQMIVLGVWGRRAATCSACFAPATSGCKSSGRCCSSPIQRARSPACGICPCRS